MDIQHSRYSVTAASILGEFKRCGITHVVTVPDMLQIALHKLLEDPACGITVIPTTTEDQAIEVASGLYAGGKRAVVLMQNQGLFASINSIRALGLDSKIPLLMLVGQFGREFSNLGDDPRKSKRRMVRILEPLLETLDIPYWRLEGPADVGGVSKAWDAAQARSGPAVAIAGHFVGWSQPSEIASA
ncbi:MULTISPECIES: thiamine pyrophosphate-binding protein [Cupriavidus]|jgi:sulfopyruvate decarboxylase subunit alpha|uniref:Thiamine pyrophosphate-binding protein n=1 Tax=Cupriavidus campinensis TaxID=151783 RepID=A0AAE9I2D6_9BURK|nr:MULTISPECIES: thiamine pyrophosphate-binding protein [Cupriavidus]MCA3183831.1 thiamine pyrophosphate-binding protein [Cupriavidus sp.]MCA3192129.1 thiamine pyrophosphate-binding protein [Cupriavidus sp.]MCA3197874.1 thiamine pyrophosphate-binding protein [Cupriavidus sp.]MCA3202927.1 thiamine pyrophosphate-binding protein [Cupriavidus sp.]MCA3206477.1 thiamine pyrophosphate-binding protein [Cupriavidus sp.]